MDEWSKRGREKSGNKGEKRWVVKERVPEKRKMKKKDGRRKMIER